MTETAPAETIEAIEAPPKARIGIIPALTVFLSAFLLFQVQPLIGKYILPWFGGAPGVWTACLVFFQVMLLAGYAYSHLVVSRLSPKVQAIMHVILLVAVLATLPIIPRDSLKPPDPDNPTGRILVLLLLTVGLPYFALATTAPLLQAWVSRLEPRVAPYRLYALSNAASLLALVSYPFVIEPVLSRRQQAWAWSGMFILFAIGCATCAWRASRLTPSHRTRGEGGGEGPVAQDNGDRSLASTSPLSPALSPEYRGEGEAPSRLTRFMWIALPACASALLLGTTNTLTQDVAPVPFLWVLPLALYLLTFVLAFDHPRWYSRRVTGWMMVVAVPAIVWAMFQPLQNISIRQMLLIYCGGLFVACLLCHGELARLRPHPRYLTAYYLAISAGGAGGGVFVSIIASLIFTRYLEFGISLWACCALLLLIAGTDRASRLRGLRPPLAWVGIIAAMVTLAYFVGVNDVTEEGAVLVGRTRNFYGVLRLHEWESKDGSGIHFLSLHHGRTMHGMQALDEPFRRSPMTYYGPHSGVAQAVQRTENRPNRRIGAIGLGVGTVAALTKPGDTIRFYEIDPDVLHIAQTSFTYLKDAPAKVEVVLGDARLSLERESPQQFDVLILDAFSGDAIPAHLLTKEAFKIYRTHVKDNGLFAIHISNRHLDLHPIVAGLAQEFGLKVIFISRPREGSEYASTWAIMGKSDSRRPPRGDEILWTDDRVNLLGILKKPQEDPAPTNREIP